MSLKKTLDDYQGHRTFLLATIILISFSIKGLFFAEGIDLGNILAFMGGLIRDVFVGLGASKVGDAAIHYARRDGVQDEPPDGKGISEGPEHPG